MMRKAIAWIGLALGLFAVPTQGYITITSEMADGNTPLLSVVHYFSYFTILTNILLVLIYLGAVVKGQAWLQVFRKPVTRAVAAACITLVAVYYHAVLAADSNSEGLSSVCNTIHHTIAPILYLIWFAVFNRSGTLKWVQALPMLAYPAIYFTYILIRGAMLNVYPYDILDAGKFGYQGIVPGVLFLLGALVVLNLAAIAIDRSLLWTRSK